MRISATVVKIKIGKSIHQIDLRKFLLRRDSTLHKSTDDAAHQAATSPINNAAPSNSQKTAGNYQMGHLTISGLTITIENPEGSVRRPEWPTTTAHYGYITGTVGNDGDHVDVFVKPGTAEDWDGRVAVIDQLNEAGTFDEHKCMLGYATLEEARRAFINHHTSNWTSRIKGMTWCSLAAFKNWLATGDMKKPCSSVPMTASKSTLQRALLKIDFDESKHARGEHGRFAAETQAKADHHSEQARLASNPSRAIDHNTAADHYALAAKSYTDAGKHYAAGRQSTGDMRFTQGDVHAAAAAEKVVTGKKLAGRVTAKSELHRALFKSSKKIKSAPQSIKAKHKAVLKPKLVAFLNVQKKALLPQLVALYSKAGYPRSSMARMLKVADETPDELIAKVKLEGWDALIGTDITPEVEAAFNAAGMSAILSVGAEMSEVNTALVNDLAAEYASKTAGDLITQLEDSTRNMLRSTVEAAINNGWSSTELADALADSQAFDDVRADRIASYELGSALEAGNLAGWQASGVVTGKQWVTAEDELVSDECQANADQGVIPLDAPFQSGDDAPLAHPYCRCSVVGVTEDDAEEQ